MKTTMKQLTAGTFIALLLLVGSVKAEGTERKASSHENIETSLQLENWMTNETIWNKSIVNMMEFVQETETTMEIENWMTSTETWNLSNEFIHETEVGMELESWMTSDDTWMVDKTNIESELKVENWMTQNNVWK